MEKVRMFLRDRLDALWHSTPSSASAASTDSTAGMVATPWKGAKGQTPFWADRHIMSSWTLEIEDAMLLHPCALLWSAKTSDDAIFSGGGEAGCGSGNVFARQLS